MKFDRVIIFTPSFEQRVSKQAYSFMKLYNHLPVWAQNIACYYEGSRIQKKRYSNIFWDTLREYESHNSWSYDQLCELRDQKLQKMIKHCYDTVPYYQGLFRDYGIDPNSIKTIDDLSILPILTKDDVKANIGLIRSSVIPEERTKVHATGGTTGAGLRFLTSDEEEAEQWAVWWRYRRWNGIDTAEWCGNFGGKTTTPLSQKKPPYWRKNAPGRQYFYSGYHINETTAPLYADHIRKTGLEWIHGYPSNLANLASYLIKHGIQLPLKWVSIGAENLYDNQADQIEKAFCVKPLQHYGLTEGVANISEREGVLTVDEDFCCIEFVPTGNANEYHIIGTSLSNFVMPLVRYDTGDLAIISEKGQHSSHGRTVDRINGRSNEYVLLPTGSKVGAAAISLIICKFDCISAMQIRQLSNNKLVINIISKVSEAEFPLNNLNDELRIRFGNEINWDIRFVNELEKTNSGKQKLVISEI